MTWDEHSAFHNVSMGVASTSRPIPTPTAVRQWAPGRGYHLRSGSDPFRRHAMRMLARIHPRHGWLLAGTGVALGASLVLAGCGGSTTAKKSPAASPVSGSSLLVKTASVGALGTVLVDGQGRTLYTLTSEASGTITCTSASGCTQVWFEFDLGSGQTHKTQGSAQAALVGSETGAKGGRLLTYHGWPLYTFSGDTADDRATGEGVSSFGGTWYALSAAGNLVKSGAKGSSPTPTPSSASGY
jgi:predicted lipoprotein with Yx(FWY)xxD motif